MIRALFGTQPILWGLWALGCIGLLAAYLFLAGLIGRFIGFGMQDDPPERVSPMPEDRRRLHAAAAPYDAPTIAPFRKGRAS